MFLSSPISTLQPSAGTLCLSLTLHLCGMTISLKAPQFQFVLVMFAIPSLFLLYHLLCQLALLWQAKRHMQTIVIPTEAILQKFMSEAKLSNFSESHHHKENLKIERQSLAKRFECVVCFEEMEDKKQGRPKFLFCWRPKPRNRALLIPCGHASLCTPCAFKLWKSRKNQCPVCRAKLTRKPKRLPAKIHL